MHCRRLLVASLVPLLCTGVALVRTSPESAPVSSPFSSANALFAPADKDGFHFVVLGDRTAGEDWGLPILREAVAEINRIGPDFVMTVGDLINGYNRREQWLEQMREYKSIMDQLDVEWYPVAGNHDVYGNDGDPKDRSNEGRYLENFGPLYYSFDYKFAHFIVLYSDENLSYKNPAVDQRMSDAQLSWLDADLRATPSRHVFAFLHHPRWNYAGGVWEPVHQVLARSGKVLGVFAGHWHRYRSDGERDGIRYYLMAGTGARIGPYEQLGDFHHFNVVSVRPDGWTMGAIPVHSVLDQDFVTGKESEEALRLANQPWLELGPPLSFARDKPLLHRFQAAFRNSSSRTLEYEVTWSTRSQDLRVTPATATVSIAAGERATLDFELSGPACTEDHPLIAPEASAAFVYALEKGGRQAITSVQRLPITRPLLDESEAADEKSPAADRSLWLDGKSACVLVPSSKALDLQPPFTLECWARVTRRSGRQAWISRTESSAYGLFGPEQPDGGASFIVYIEGTGYARAETEPGALPADRWTHLAGVYDGKSVRLFVDGSLRAEVRHEGRVRANELPLIVGADVDRNGAPTAFASGSIDEVRISRCARYEGDFRPSRRFSRDSDTVLLLHLDRVIGNLTPDCSTNGLHGEVLGSSELRDWRTDDR